MLKFERDFGDIAVKGKQSMGNLLTKNEVQLISLKSKGGSTMGGRGVWFDQDVLRINYEQRGRFLGEFQSDDQILVVLKNGDYYTTDFDDNNHFGENILRIDRNLTRRKYGRPCCLMPTKDSSISSVLNLSQRKTCQFYWRKSKICINIAD